MSQKTSAATNRLGERGASAVVLAGLISLAAIGLVKVVQMRAQDTIGATYQAARSSTLRSAGQTAAELVAQLAGNDIVTVSDTKFAQGGGVGALLTGTNAKLTATGTELKPKGANPVWRLDKNSGHIFVTTCMRPPEDPSEAAATKPFGNNNSAAWVAKACDKNHLATTEVTPKAFYGKTSDSEDTRGSISEKSKNYYKQLGSVSAVVGSGGTSSLSGSGLEAKLADFSGDNYRIAKIALKTTLPGKPTQVANQTARIALTDASRSCGSDGVGCRTDHCPFMKEARLGNAETGPIRYKADGTPFLVPNENFQKPLNLTIDFSAHAPNFDPNSGTSPTKLVDWYEEIFGPGRRNPFRQKQGIYGYFPQVTYFIDFIPGTNIATLNVPLMPDNGAAVANGNVKFDAYLYKAVPPSDPNFGVGSAKWYEWPKNGQQPYTYEELAPYLKWGCIRTVGDASPDFCTKIDVTYAQQKYVYPKQRTCVYKMPSEEQPADYDPPSSLNSFDKERLESLVSLSAPEVVTSPTPLTTTVDDNRTIWPDDRAHVPFDKQSCPTPECMTAVPHVYNDVKIGQRIVTYYNLIGGAPTADEVADDSGSGSGGGSGGSGSGGATSYKYKKFVRTETFEVTCTETDFPLNESPDPKNLTACIYLKNYGVYNRSTCDQQQVPVICRNGDGCFAPDTKITMADGTTKLVQAVVPGDMVMNPMSLAPLRVASISAGDELAALYAFKTKIGELKVTSDHPIVTRHGVRRAEFVKLGDEILGGDGRTWYPILTIKKASDANNPLVYNLTLETDSLLKGASHLVIANGLLSGDLAAQTDAKVREEINELLRRMPAAKFSENDAK